MDVVPPVDRHQKDRLNIGIKDEFEMEATYAARRAASDFYHCSAAWLPNSKGSPVAIKPSEVHPFSQGKSSCKQNHS